MSSFSDRYGETTVGEARQMNDEQTLAELDHGFTDWANGLKDEDLLGVEYSKIARRLKTLYNIFLGTLAILAASVVWAIIEEFSK